METLTYLAVVLVFLTNGDAALISRQTADLESCGREIELIHEELEARVGIGRLHSTSWWCAPHWTLEI